MADELDAVLAVAIGSWARISSNRDGTRVAQDTPRHAARQHAGHGLHDRRRENLSAMYLMESALLGAGISRPVGWRG